MIHISEEDKKLFEMPNIKKQLRIEFPNGEHKAITNDQIDGSNSFRFSESLCSNDKLKFGKSEASVLEFTAIGIDNIKGCEINVSMIVDAQRKLNIKLGTFVVDSCLKEDDRQNVRKVTAYSKDMDFDENLPVMEKFKRDMRLYVKNKYTYNPYALLFHVVDNVNLAETRTIDIPFTYNQRQLSFGYYGANGDYVVFYIGCNAFNVTQAIRDGIMNENNTYYHHGFTRSELYTELDLLRLQRTFDRFFPGEKPEGLEENYFNDMYEAFGWHYRWIDSTTNPTKVKECSGHTKTLYPFYSFNASEPAGVETFINIPIDFSMTIHNATDTQTYTYQFSRTPNLYKIIRDYPKMSLSVPRKKVKANYFTASESFKDVNTNELFESAIELQGKFGRYNRNGDYELIKLKTDALYPSKELYPSTELYPKGFSCHLYDKSQYSRLWIDDDMTKPYAYVSATYTDTLGNDDNYARVWIVDEEEYEANHDKYQGYSVGTNYIVDNQQWTEATITQVLQGLADAIKDIQYMPFQIEAIGLPYLEAGDGVSVVANGRTVRSYILRRTMTGIKSLFDTCESK